MVRAQRVLPLCPRWVYWASLWISVHILQVIRTLGFWSCRGDAVFVWHFVSNIRRVGSRCDRWWVSFPWGLAPDGCRHCCLLTLWPRASPSWSVTYLIIIQINSTHPISIDVIICIESLSSDVSALFAEGVHPVLEKYAKDSGLIVGKEMSCVENFRICDLFNCLAVSHNFIVNHDVLN